MKTIAFFVRNIDAGQYPFVVRDLYYYSYQEFLLALKRSGVKAYFVSGNDSYLGKGRFSQAYTIDAVSEVADFTAVGEITADLVYEKGGFEGIDIPVVTDARLRKLMDDKGSTYSLFKQYQPRTVTCASAQEVAAALAELPGELAVIKSPLGSGGNRVYIGPKDTLEVPDNETYPILVQEFVDMSDGLPGLCPGVHDIRVMMAGLTIIGATLREPAAGSLHANVSKGGTERLLSVDEIPEEAKRIARAIDAHLENLPRYYAIDLVKGKEGWRLMELNGKPGLFRESNGPLARGFMDSAARYMAGIA